MATKKPISKKVDKRRRAKIIVGHHADGTPIIKYASGRTQAELDANIAELRRSYTGNGQQIEREVIFGAYLQAWYRSRKEQRLSESSRISYRSVINGHILPAFGDRQLRAITAMELQAWIDSKAGMGKTSIGYMHSIICNVFRAATAEGVIDRNPSLSLQAPRADKESRRALTDEETAAAKTVMATHPDGLLLAILYYTGLRIGEALGLRWSDIDMRRKMIRVERDIDYTINGVGELKSAASHREVPMPDELIAALDAKRGIGDNYIFTAPRTRTHLSKATYLRRWHSLMQAMYAADPSIETRQKETTESVLTAHYFRHNYASVLYNAGVDILAAQRFLGHSDVKTTLSIYAHLSDRKEDSAADIVRAALSNFEVVAKRLPDQSQDVIK